MAKTAKPVKAKQRANSNGAKQSYRIRVLRARKRKGVRLLIEADLDGGPALRLASQILRHVE